MVTIGAYNSLRVKKEIDRNSLGFLKLSMSFGTATKTKEEENIVDIVRKSEERMYFNKLIESKEAKKNMIDLLIFIITILSNLYYI